jgi:VIT1/CCC1 family predicted Fe2+/Mn2+ transporter
MVIGSYGNVSMEDPMHDHEPQSLSGLARHYLGDLVYGANDGIITTFAVVAAVSGASLSARTVLILGFANLVADGFSMGASNVLAIRSGQDIRTADGLEKDEPFAFRHGTATFVAFVLAGAIPLAAYMFPGTVASPFSITVVLTLLTLFVVGALRSLVTRAGWLKSGMEMLLLGVVASALAYVVGGYVAGLT